MPVHRHAGSVILDSVWIEVGAEAVEAQYCLGNILAIQHVARTLKMSRKILMEVKNCSERSVIKTCGGRTARMFYSTHALLESVCEFKQC